MYETVWKTNIHHLIHSQLRPLVASIDEEGKYPKDFLQGLGATGVFQYGNTQTQDSINHTLSLIEQLAETCASTSFLVWCHAACMNYIRKGTSDFLKHEILPDLEECKILGSTGLSNPMKYYAGLEPIRLQAQETKDGYIISGALPAVSNLAENHWFGIVAELDSERRIMAVVPCNASGFSLSERNGFLGLNGTATYACLFHDVCIPYEWIVADDADSFITNVRYDLLLNQTGIGLGIAASSIKNTLDLLQRQEEHLFPYRHPEELHRLHGELCRLWNTLALQSHKPTERTKHLLRLRLDTTYLALEAAHLEMLYGGGSAYIRKSHASRHLREAYFVAALTPTVKQLERQLR